MFVRVIKQTDFCFLLMDGEKNNYFVVQNHYFNQDGLSPKLNINQTYYVNVMSYGMEVYIDGELVSTKPILLKTGDLDSAIEKLESIHSFV